MPGHNTSIIQPSDYNQTTGIVMARDLMKVYNSTCAGWDSTYPGSDEELWLNVNLLGRNLEINRHLGITNLRLNQLLESNLKLIGIELNETIRDWDKYLDTGRNRPWEMDLNYIGLCPDYINPYNMLDQLFNLESEKCFSRINDSTAVGLTEMMRNAISETNRTKQLEIYGNIQSYIFDVDRPLTPASHVHISGWVYLLQQIHKKTLKGVQYNVLELFKVANWYWEDT
jgi:ABC-type oligopeptide transport system substrate-binding subunit